jgi:hypothetical protein
VHKPLSDDDINEILQIMDQCPRKLKWARFAALDCARRVAFKQAINSISKKVDELERQKYARLGYKCLQQMERAQKATRILRSVQKNMTLVHAELIQHAWIPSNRDASAQSDVRNGIVAIERWSKDGSAQLRDFLQRIKNLPKVDLQEYFVLRLSQLYCETFEHLHSPTATVGGPWELFLEKCWRAAEINHC